MTKFKEGKYYVYPAHGLGLLTDISERLGEEMLTFKFEKEQGKPDLQIQLPATKTEEVGVRKVVSRERAKEILDIISAVNKKDGTLAWVRFVKNCEIASISGDIEEIAVAYRQLRVKHVVKDSASPKESTLKAKTEKLLSEELAVSLNRKPENVVKELRKRSWPTWIVQQT